VKWIYVVDVSIFSKLSADGVLFIFFLDVEGTLNVIFSLLRKLDAASVDDLAKKLVGKITSDPNDKPLLRIKM